MYVKLLNETTFQSVKEEMEFIARDEVERKNKAIRFNKNNRL